MENKNGKILIAFLAGAAIGVGMGILLAPHKGRKTRRKIRHSVVGTTYDVSNWLKHTTDELTKTAQEKKDAFEGHLEDAYSKMSHKAEGLMTSIEDKLEDIKHKNA